MDKLYVTIKNGCIVPFHIDGVDEVIFDHITKEIESKKHKCVSNNNGKRHKLKMIAKMHNIKIVYEGE